MKCVGGDWKRRGTHLDEAGKENVYVAKDMKYEELEDGNSYLENILLKRKDFLDGLGIDGFITADPKLKKMKIDNIDVLYKYYIPWNMHYTHNEHGYGHITYSNIIKRQHNTYEIKYHYGIGKEGSSLIQCDKKMIEQKDDKCNIHWWGSINKLNSYKPSIKFRFKKENRVEVPIVNSTEFANEFTYPREQVSYRWAMPTKDIIEDIEKAYLLAHYEFLTDNENPSKLVNDIRTDVYNKEYSIDILNDEIDPIHKNMDAINSKINLKLFLKDKEIHDKKMKETSLQRLQENTHREVIGKQSEEPEEHLSKKEKKKKIFTKKKERKKLKESTNFLPEEIVAKLNPIGSPIKPNIPDALLQEPEPEPYKEPEPEPYKEPEPEPYKEPEQMIPHQNMISMQQHQNQSYYQQPTIYEQQQRAIYEQQPTIYEQQPTIYEQQPTMYEQQQRAMYEQQQRAMYEQQQRDMYEQQQRDMYEQQQRAMYEQQQRDMYEQQHRDMIYDVTMKTWRNKYEWEYE